MSEHAYWQGYLKDDCSKRDGDLLAHVEKMDAGQWFCGISDESSPPGKQLFHSMEDDLWFRCGVDARRFAEWFMRAIQTGWERL